MRPDYQTTGNLMFCRENNFADNYVLYRRKFSPWKDIHTRTKSVLGRVRNCVGASSTLWNGGVILRVSA